MARRGRRELKTTGLELGIAGVERGQTGLV